MHILTNSYRSVSMMLQIGAGRILVPLAILLSLMMAASVSYWIYEASLPASGGIF